MRRTCLLIIFLLLERRTRKKKNQNVLKVFFSSLSCFLCVGCTIKRRNIRNSTHFGVIHVSIRPYNMKSIIFMLCIIIVLCDIIKSAPIDPFHYHRRRSRRSVRFPSPSGSIPGTSYYGKQITKMFFFLIIFLLCLGVGSDPNYGSFISRPNRPNGHSIVPVSYNSNSQYYQNLLKQTHHALNHQRPSSSSSNNRNSWQHPSKYNYNRYANYNRYEPGTEAWYATGGNYWFNCAQSLVLRPCLLILCVVIGYFWK